MVNRYFSPFPILTTERLTLRQLSTDDQQDIFALRSDTDDAGAKEIYPVSDQDYGYRLGHIVDPFGHHWEIFKPLHPKSDQNK
jgi:uncharacterized glyoxalase superfamily protein PhnB